MFDIAFSELLVIALVALIVIGPERLPKVARVLGAMAGRMQRYVAQVKDEISREARFEELQQLQQEIQATADTNKQKLKASLQNVIDAEPPADTEPTLLEARQREDSHDVSAENR